MKRFFVVLSSIFIVFLSFITAVSAQTIPAQTETNGFLADTCETGRNQYSNNSFKIIHSYMEPTENGFMRICGQNHDNKIIIEYYDNELKPIAQKTVDFELPKFGGFYNGKDNFFVVFGQDNPNEDSSQEVLRIVKYDKNWNKIAHGSVLGNNTKNPFNFGTLRMVEGGNRLIIRTCHIMYKSDDGLNHQANMTIKVDEPTMDTTVLLNGYVSHSFNQFIINDDNNVITLDHGDAYPRAAVLEHQSFRADGSAEVPYAEKNIIEYYGETGQNITNATVGGLEASDSNYLTVGCSTPQTSMDSSGKNIYVSSTSKSDFENTNVRWLTKESLPNVTPQLVKFDNNNFLVIWNKSANVADNNPQGSYVFVDGAGNPKGEVRSFNGQISDCQPTVKDGKAYWIDALPNGTTRAFSIDGAGTISETALKGTLVPVYRLYNSATGEHLYTSDKNEYDSLSLETARANKPGWEPENVCWNAPSSGDPVFRLYNPVLADHLYTTDQNEVNVLTSQQGWQIDNGGQPLFYSGGTIPIFRLYDNNSHRHLLTKDENEYKTLGGSGWKQEGPALSALG